MMITSKLTALFVPLIMSANQASAYKVELNDGALSRHGQEPNPPQIPAYEVTSLAPDVDGRDEAEPRCVSDTEGFFGDSTGNGLTLEYYFELDYDTTILPRVNKRVLKFLQNKISDLILPVLFASACSNSRRLLTESLRRRLEVIGISALPDDIILPGVRCSSFPPADGIACSVGLGRASIFAQAGAVVENEGTRAITAIQAIMNNGALDRSFEGIEHVRFINGTYTKGLDPSVISSEPGTEQESEQESSGADGLAGWAIALIALTALLVAAIVALFVVQHKKRREREERQKLNNRMISMHLDELERNSVGDGVNLNVTVE